jgi:hypothetical protein
MPIINAEKIVRLLTTRTLTAKWTVESQLDYEKALGIRFGASDQRREGCVSNRRPEAGSHQDGNQCEKSKTESQMDNRGITRIDRERRNDVSTTQNRIQKQIALLVTAEEIIEYIDPDPNESIESILGKQIQKEIDRELLEEIMEIAEKMEKNNVDDQ